MLLIEEGKCTPRKIYRKEIFLERNLLGRKMSGGRESNGKMSYTRGRQPLTKRLDARQKEGKMPLVLIQVLILVQSVLPQSLAQGPVPGRSAVESEEAPKAAGQQEPGRGAAAAQRAVNISALCCSDRSVRFYIFGHLHLEGFLSTRDAGLPCLTAS